MRFASIVVAMTSFLCLIHTGFAQDERKTDTSVPNPIVHLDKADAASFVSLLKSLSAQTHTAFVAEGIPLHPNTAAKDFTLLCNSDEPLVSKLQSVARVFDYTVDMRKDVCIFRKRYSDAEDIPSITYEECLLFAKYMKELAKNLTSGIRRSDIDTPLRDLMTPEQLNLYETTGLPFSQMTAAQQDYTQRIVRDMGFNFGTTYFGYDQMVAIVRRDIHLRYRKSGEFNHGETDEEKIKNVLGVQNHIGLMSETFQGTFIPLSGFGVQRRRQNEFMEYKVVPNDLTEWKSEDDARIAERDNVSDVYTLSEASDLLEKLNDTSDIFTVGEAWRRKKIISIGQSRQNVRSVYQAIANVYNLEVMRGDNNRLTIVGKMLAPKANILDKLKFLEEMYPASLPKWLMAEQGRQEVAVRRAFPAFQDNLPGGYEEYVYENLKYRLCKRIRHLTEADVNRNKGYLPLIDLKPEIRQEVYDLLGIMELLNMDTEIQTVMKRGDWRPLRQFEKVVLLGNRKVAPDGDLTGGVKLLTREADGKMLIFAESSYHVPAPQPHQ